MAKQQKMSKLRKMLSEGCIMQAYTLNGYFFKVYPLFEIDKVKFSFVEKGKAGTGFDIYVNTIDFHLLCEEIDSGMLWNKICNDNGPYPKAWEYVTGDNASMHLVIGKSKSQKGGIVVQGRNTATKKQGFVPLAKYDELRALSFWYKIVAGLVPVTGYYAALRDVFLAGYERTLSYHKSAEYDENAGYASQQQASQSRPAQTGYGQNRNAPQNAQGGYRQNNAGAQMQNGAQRPQANTAPPMNGRPQAQSNGQPSRNVPANQMQQAPPQGRPQPGQVQPAGNYNRPAQQPQTNNAGPGTAAQGMNGNAPKDAQNAPNNIVPIRQHAEGQNRLPIKDGRFRTLGPMAEKNGAYYIKVKSLAMNAEEKTLCILEEARKKNDSDMMGRFLETAGKQPTTFYMKYAEKGDILYFSSFQDLTAKAAQG